MTLKMSVQPVWVRKLWSISALVAKWTVGLSLMVFTAKTILERSLPHKTRLLHWSSRLQRRSELATPTWLMPTIIKCEERNHNKYEAKINYNYKNTHSICSSERRRGERRLQLSLWGVFGWGERWGIISHLRFPAESNPCWHCQGLLASDADLDRDMGRSHICPILCLGHFVLCVSLN